jgi:ATP-dependent Clp protease ATP-binding subunit ClpA
MTSNIGSQFIQKMQTIGFSDHSHESEYKEMKTRVMDSLKDFFRPEFLNRLDEIVVFDTLSKEVIREIVTLRVDQVLKRMTEKEISVTLTPEVYDYLAEKGYDPQFGARPLNRLIQSTVVNKLASMIISGEVTPGSKVEGTLKHGEIILTKKGRGKTVEKRQPVRA